MTMTRIRHSNNNIITYISKTTIVLVGYIWSLAEITLWGSRLGCQFSATILDQGYHADMSREDALLDARMFSTIEIAISSVNSPQLPVIKCVDPHGCHVLQP